MKTTKKKNVEVDSPSLFPVLVFEVAKWGLEPWIRRKIGLANTARRGGSRYANVGDPRSWIFVLFGNPPPILDFCGKQVLNYQHYPRPTKTSRNLVHPNGPIHWETPQEEALHRNVCALNGA